VVVRVLSMLGVSTGRRGVSVLRVGDATGGDGRGPGAEWSAVENLMVCLAGIADKMSVAAGRVNTFMARQFLSKFDIATGGKDDGNKVMSKVMYPDFVFINTRLHNAALYVVPNIAGVNGFDEIPSPLIVANEKGLRLRRSAAFPDVISEGIYGTSGNIDNGLLIPLADNNGSLLVPVNILDFQVASLMDAQAGISQKQNKCSISKVCNILSYSIHVLDNLLDSILIEYWEALAGLVGEASIGLLKEGRVDRVVVISRRQVQASNSRSANGLRGSIHARSCLEKLCIRFLREWRINADNINKLSQSVPVSRECPGALGFADEVKKLVYSVLHGQNLLLSNANYIREC
jgi:transcription antitermination factor NusG